MSFDATGAYFLQCRDYLVAHGIRPASPVSVSPREPPAHRACKYAGLAQDTPDYGRCVQQMNMLDISSSHL